MGKKGRPGRGAGGGAAAAGPAGNPPPRVERVDAFRWRIPRQGRMRVDGLVFADDRLMEQIRGDEAVRQVANVAELPGIVGRSIGMPDIHWGYGFAIGGVAAFDPDEGGVVSPGGVGYDINCGVRLLRTTLPRKEVEGRLPRLMDRLLRDIPAGVGAGYKQFKLSDADVRAVLREGARWAVRHGYGTGADLERIEAGGAIPGADPDAVSARAVERGRDQLGTVGSGNHFIEIDEVAELFDADTARAFGLEPGHLAVLIHSGSRGLGYQVCDDFLATMLRSAAAHGIQLPDRQLACAPLGSPEATRYLAAMGAAANFAFANRQMMAHRVRAAFEAELGRPWAELGLELIYDVAHNIAKRVTKSEVRRIPALLRGAPPKIATVECGLAGVRRLISTRNRHTRAERADFRRRMSAHTGRPRRAPGRPSEFRLSRYASSRFLNFLYRFSTSCRSRGERWSMNRTPSR